MISKNIDFYPHKKPFGDFFIVKNVSEIQHDEFIRLGANVTAFGCWKIYTWGFDFDVDKIMLIGFGVINEKLQLGPKAIEYVDSCRSGTYCILNPNKATGCISVEPDPFGMLQIFTSDSFVTNRLHLAKIFSASINNPSVYSNFLINHMLCQQLSVFETPVSDVQLVPVMHKVSLSSSGVCSSYPIDSGLGEELSPEEYKDMILEGVKEVKKDVEAIVNSEFSVMADISGGKDSRIVFSAIKSTGNIGNVFFNTNYNGNNLRDLEIASALVKKHGGSYDNSLEVIGYESYSTELAIDQRRSHLFGACHDFNFGQFRPYHEIYEKPFVRLLGGCGELFRDYYQSLFNLSFDQLSGSDHGCLVDKLNGMLSSSDVDFPEKSFVVDLYKATFQSLSDNNVDQALDNHYLNFRNRFHFGLRVTKSENIINISPAANLKLLKAARGLPISEKSSGRVLFDITYALDRFLPFYGYDKNFDLDFLGSEYSLFNSSVAPEVIDLTGEVDFYKRSRLNQNLAPGLRRPNHKISRDEIKSELLRFSLQNVSELGADFLLDKKFLDKLNQYESKRPLRFNTWVSRLISFCDYYN